MLKESDQAPGFRVRFERCNQCLFSKGKIVNNDRMRDVLATCARKDSHFICHKATINGATVCCRAFYDRDPSATNGMRIAGRLGAVVFTDDFGRPVELPEAKVNRASSFGRDETRIREGINSNPKNQNVSKKENYEGEKA